MTRDSRRCSRCLGSGLIDQNGEPPMIAIRRNTSGSVRNPCTLCDGTGRRPKSTQISYKAFLAAETPQAKLNELVLLFTRINHNGARTELSTFLMLPGDTLFTIAWGSAWELGLIKQGSNFGTSQTEFYLTEAGRIHAFKLGRVWSTYGWRSVLSKASGVPDQVERMRKLSQEVAS